MLQVRVGYAGPGSVAVQWVTWPQDKGDSWWTRNRSYANISNNRKLLLYDNQATAIELTKHISSKTSHCEKMQQAGIRSVVQYGFQPSAYDFSIEVANGVNCYELGDYLSGALHTVIIGEEEGPLPPNTAIYYRVGDPDVSLSQEFSFVSAPKVGARSLPYRLGLLGDLGQTEHSLSTLEHLGAQNVSSVLFAGDLSYADGYQPRWDTWGRMMQPMAANTVLMYTEGNHEQEHSDGPSDWLSYTSRFHLPSRTCRSSSPLYYSYEVAGIHIIMLGSYADYDKDSEQ